MANNVGESNLFLGFGFRIDGNYLGRRISSESLRVAYVIDKDRKSVV